MVIVFLQLHFVKNLQALSKLCRGDVFEAFLPFIVLPERRKQGTFK
jgi:hypothetical protein